MIERLPSGVGHLQDFFSAIRVLRAPLILSLIAYFALSTPQQVLELYLILARGLPGSWPQVLAAALTLIMLAMFVVYAARSVARASHDPAKDTTPRNRILWNLPIFLGILPLAGVVVGLLGAWRSTITESTITAVDLVRALRSEQLVMAAVRKVQEAEGKAGQPMILTQPEFKQLNNRVSLTFPQAIRDLPEQADALAVSIYCGIGLAAAGALFVGLYFTRWQPYGYFAPRKWVFHPLFGTCIAASFAVLTLLFAAQHWNAGGAPGFDYTKIPRAIGTLALVNLCLIGLVFATTLLTRWGDRLRIPLLTLIFVLAVIFSSQNWNDNHHVRLVKSSPDELAARRIGAGKAATPELSSAFEAWLAARPADYVKRFEGRPYPIYVVAAQGGGMYAANLSGLTLARLYDLCPAIRHHLFAVSAVSGGSVGAGYLAALLAEDGWGPTSDHCGIEAPKGGTGPLEAKMEELLQADFLAPVAASFLFPDLLQRFIPFPIIAFDRARAFEAGLEQTWRGSVKSGSDRLAAPLWRQWKPDGAAPMLFLNTTIAASGHPLALAPVRFQARSQPTNFELKTLHERTGLDEALDVPLSTAMSLSARFPVVMPAGLVATKSSVVHLVDGGYFENSAIESARYVIEQLATTRCGGSALHFSKCAAKEPDGRAPLAFRTMVLTEFDELRETITSGDRTREAPGLNELLSPVRASLNTRVARGDLAVSRQPDFRLPRADLLGEIREEDVVNVPTAIPAIKIYLNHQLYELPLGWQLSREVQRIISAQIGDPLLCVRTTPMDLALTGLMLSIVIDGIEQIKAEAQRRDARKDVAKQFVAMFYKLKSNHCSLFHGLALDGVVAMEQGPTRTAQ